MAGPFYDKGRYRCSVTNQALSESSKKGTPQVVVRFKVLEFENGQPVHSQYERSAYLYITEKSAERTVQCLKTLGYTRDSFRFIDKSQPGHHDMAGAEFIAFCDHENDLEGNSREKWGIAVEGGEFEAKPLESKKLREIDNLFGKALRSNGGKPPAPARAAQPAAAMASTVGDDDVPF